jgi:hypothetical protein
MRLFEQRWLSAAEKLKAQQSRRATTHTRRKIGSVGCSAVAGMSSIKPMT